MKKHSGMQEIFARIYRERQWGQDETLSGPGSTAQRTEAIRRRLPELLRSIQARSLLDAPCGDYNWMRLMPLEIERYVGVDIVPEIIRNNQERFGSGRVEFVSCDITRDPLPACEVVLCRDCLVHLSFRDVCATLENFRRTGAKFLLTTTFVDHPINADIATGDWRQLNLERPPFAFPPPLEAINEEWGGGLFIDKRLALWPFEALPR